jgi:hypothetical protein
MTVALGPVIPVTPDLSGAIRAYLRSIPALAAIVADRVWIGWPRSPDGTLRVKVPPYLDAILIESGRGGLAEPEAPYRTERVDLSCLGPTEEAANTLWRTLDAYLIDVRRVRPPGFRAANTLVSGVTAEVGPYRTTDAPTGWPRTWGTYLFRYCTLPLSDITS